MNATMNTAFGYAAGQAASSDPAQEFRERFAPSAKQIFNQARSQSDGVATDPRAQDAPAWRLGRFQSASPSSELDTWFDAYAQPATGKFYMQDVNTNLWYSADLPQD